MLARPDQYQEEARNLVDTLMAEHREPTSVERQVLDLAVLEYVQPTAFRNTAAGPSRLVTDTTTDEPQSTPDETPGGIVSPYWWRTDSAGEER